jgi:hypothetical protein
MQRAEVSRKLIVGERRLHFALDQQAPCLAVMDDNVGEALSLGVLFHLRSIARQTLLDEQQLRRANGRRNTYPVEEITEQSAIFVETNRKCVGQTILITFVLIEQVAHRAC